MAPSLAFFADHFVACLAALLMYTKVHPAAREPRASSSSKNPAREMGALPCFTPDMVGLGGFEPPTPRLSSVCSNQLSYRPEVLSIRDQVICVSAQVSW